MYMSLLIRAETDTGRRGQKVILIALVTPTGWGEKYGEGVYLQASSYPVITLMFHILTLKDFPDGLVAKHRAPKSLSRTWFNPLSQRIKSHMPQLRVLMPIPHAAIKTEDPPPPTK